MPRNFLQIFFAAIATFVIATIHSASFAQARHALLIGNNAYPSAPLLNAAQDALVMSKTLARAGYSITTIEDGNRETMLKGLQQLVSVVAPNDEIVFFYAGHGVQFQDRNYLLPIDSKVSNEEDVALSSIDFEELLDLLSGTRPKSMLVILDACRNNPFGDKVPVKQRGLAQPRIPPNTLIVYSTAPGEVASDEGDGNGIFVQHFVKNITQSNVSIESILKVVRAEVMRATKDLQVPWDSSTLTQPMVISTDTATLPDVQNVEVLRERASDLFWESMQGRSDLQSLEEFLSRFPNSRHAPAAKSRLVAVYAEGDKQVAAAKDELLKSQVAMNDWLMRIADVQKIPSKQWSFLKVFQTLLPEIKTADIDTIKSFERAVAQRRYHVALAASFAQEGVVLNLQHSMATPVLANSESLKLCEYARRGVGDRWPNECQTFYSDGDWMPKPILRQLAQMTAVEPQRFVQLVVGQLKAATLRLLATP